jgi:hypothetical protein
MGEGDLRPGGLNQRQSQKFCVETGLRRDVRHPITAWLEILGGTPTAIRLKDSCDSSDSQWRLPRPASPRSFETPGQTPPEWVTNVPLRNAGWLRID